MECGKYIFSFSVKDVFVRPKEYMVERKIILVFRVALFLIIWFDVLYLWGMKK